MGVRNRDGTCKSALDFENDLNVLSEHSNHLKIFSVSECDVLQNLGPVAENKGFKVLFGVWPDKADILAGEKATLRAHLPQISRETVSGILVGSEALYRKSMTAQKLAEVIGSIKTLLLEIKDKNGMSYGSVPVGTVDSWNELVDLGSTPAIKAVDFVFVNAFSYWQGQNMNNASYSFFDDIMQALQTIQTLKGATNIRFWVGETGWPTDGESFKEAVPSVSNARKYWIEAICAIRLWGIPVYLFEAFDEPLKLDTADVKEVEKHWGAFTVDRKLKYDLSC